MLCSVCETVRLRPVRPATRRMCVAKGDLHI